MVTARLDDGQLLTGLNEIYIGHPTHQSSRYTVSTVDGKSERHSSSGVGVGTGTGATARLSSISNQRIGGPALPRPEEAALAWFVREAWPSKAAGATMTAGLLGPAERLALTCESERLVVFADGLEQDGWTSAGANGRRSLSERKLHLVTPETR